MSKYICTSKGFVKDAVIKTEMLRSDVPKHLKFDILYTNKIREAKLFTTKQAGCFLEKYKIDGFIYSPYEEEPVKDMFDIKYVQDIWRSYAAPLRNAGKYVAIRVKMTSESDAKFLYNRGNITSTLFTETEAKELAIKKNQELINFINNNNENI